MQLRDSCRCSGVGDMIRHCSLTRPLSAERPCNKILFFSLPCVLHMKVEGERWLGWRPQLEWNRHSLTPPTIGAFFYLTRNPNRHFLSVGVLLEKFRSLKCHQQSNLTKEARCCWYFGYSPPPVAEQLWCQKFLQQLRPSKEYRYNSSNSGPGDLKNGSHLPAPRFDNNCSGFFRPDAPDRAFNRR